MKKGALDSLTIILVVAGVIVGIGATSVYMSDSQDTGAVTQDVDYDGAFEAFQPLQEIAGYNDLSVTAQTLNSTGMVDDASLVSSFNVNESDGQVIRYAFGFDVDGPMESVDVEVLNNGVSDNFDVRSVKIIADEDDEQNIDDVTPVKEFIVDSDDEVDGTITGLEDGEYAFVLETRGVDTAAITGDQDLYTVEMEADTDADSDEAEDLYATIDNAATP